ncbi:hypothetical protein ACJ7K1_03395 [Paenibacillus elgii]
MKKRFPTFIDDSVLIHEEIGISGGKKGVELLLNGKDLSKGQDFNWNESCPYSGEDYYELL